MKGMSYDLESLTAEEMKSIIATAPDRCPITGLRKCESYMFSEGVVYLPTPAYDAYTFPTFDHDDLSFSRIKIDMDDDYRREYEWLCNLSDILNFDNFEEIRKLYEITDDEIEMAREELR